jgi:hypothetical protein
LKYLVKTGSSGFMAILGSRAFILFCLLFLHCSTWRQR